MQSKSIEGNRSQSKAIEVLYRRNTVSYRGEVKSIEGNRMQSNAFDCIRLQSKAIEGNRSLREFVAIVEEGSFTYETSKGC